MSRRKHHMCELKKMDFLMNITTIALTDMNQREKILSEGVVLVPQETKS